MPTVEGVVGLTNYGPSGKMFTLSRNYGVQQYDLNPNDTPAQVASVQHIPANTPPTPPTTFDSRKELPALSRGISDAAALPSVSDTGESSTDEGATRSPLQRIAREMESLDAMEDELRDKVMPLSPVSSRGSSVSSNKSSGRRRGRKYLYDRPDSSKAPSSVGGGTEFSMDSPALKLGHDSMSIRSVSSLHSTSRYRTSNLRNQVLRSPEDARGTAAMDLFPSARARLRDVPFRPPHYGNVARTPELLQREMLSVLFGWNDTARSLIRDEMQRHKPGSAATILLAKWLGDIGADMASMIGSESMTSADWMMLALSSIGVDSQKKVGEAFVQRLLEKGDVHPAVAILVGLGENNDAIEVYVSQKYWLEAVLLTCVTCPADWQRISHLIREWGAAAVQLGQSELAVRCFSCTSIETSEPWFSPRAQDAAYAAQQEKLTRPPSAGPPLASPPLSPPSRSGSQRLAQKNASLKLITSFGDKGAPIQNTIGNTLDLPTPTNAMGVTPIAQSAMPFSALSPGGTDPWQVSRPRNPRDPTSARTATPGGYRKRIPSKSDIERIKEETSRMATPVTAARDIPPVPRPSSRRSTSLGSNSIEPTTALKPTAYTDRLEPRTALQDENHLPSPSAGAFNRVRRNTSQERKPDGLAVQIVETRYDENSSLGPSTDQSLTSPPSRAGAASVASSKSAASRSIDDYITGVEEAMERERENRARSRARAESKKREGSRGRRTGSKPRELSATRGPGDVRYIKPAKRSPSSPVPMSPEEIAQASQAARLKPEPATSEDESFYKVASPVDSHKSLRSFRSEPKPAIRRQSPDRRPRSDSVNNTTAPPAAADKAIVLDDTRGRPNQRQPGSTARSPSSPLPMPMQTETQTTSDQIETNSDGQRVRLRADTHSAADDKSRRGISRERRERSSSRKAVQRVDALGMPESDVSKSSMTGSSVTASALSGVTDDSEPRASALRRKELAQRELEERRLSLARRPSAPSIPLPGQMQARPPMAPRANTENSPTSYAPQLSRAQSVDPEQLTRYGKITGTSTPSAPIGLPATPRAMRHPRYMSTDPNEREGTPPVPEIPENVSALSSMGSSLSQVSNSNLDSMAPSNVMSNLTSNLTSNVSSGGSYLTSNVSYGSSALSSQVSSNAQYDEDDNVAPLLPSTVFGQKAPYTRSATAPPEKSSAGVHHAYKSTVPSSNRRTSHVRKIAPPDSHDLPVASIDEALANSGDQVVVIPEPDNPPMLPELQHLAGPPPPPPPPPKLTTQLPVGPTNSSGVISIAIGENEPHSAIDLPVTLPSTTYPQPMERDTMSPMERATTASPTAQRRGRGSVSESFGSRFRDLSDRMRSTSRNRVKTPVEYRPAPYESVPPPPMPSQHYRRESESRAKSPYEQAMADRNRGQIPPPPPPPPQPFALPEGRLDETTIPPSTLPRSQSAMGGYRNPKEIRANMPPETLQQGVYPGPGGYL